MLNIPERIAGYSKTTRVGERAEEHLGLLSLLDLVSERISSAYDIYIYIYIYIYIL